ncbi:hypothetical protein C2R22_21600 (plasmid) [Salinigranum rubrum]|uniref:FAD-binding PCMH-type domain-containing protein n=1 Tax=Salinigranum rubrum TaxID=755307 RepID=A0A2I8VQH2_9EURY|nr:FAD binding domain-containing protein [Salinigranum rubrum]AUV84171.1 hypothetical protein C2R22_21600 [Salinigranum rubrum]
MPVEAYHRPTTLDDALALNAEHASLEVISGGTLTMPAVNEGHLFPAHVMDLRGVGLDYVDEADGHLSLGATLTMTEVLDRIDVPILRQAARHTGSWAVRNMATVGGNLFAPPPLGDFAVALLALDAAVEVRSSDADRHLPMADFYTADGNALAPDELVTEIRIPVPAGETAFLKLTRKQEPAPPVVTVAVDLIRDGDTVDRARIAMNGAGPHPTRMAEAESVLEGSGLSASTIERAADAATEAANPPEDAVASAWYRRKMAGTYLTKALDQISHGEDTQ